MTIAMVRLDPLAIAGGPWDNHPGSIKINGIRVDSPLVGWTDGEFMMCGVIYSGDRPTEFHTLASETPSRIDTTVTIIRTWSPRPLAVVKTALKSRLNGAATQQWFSGRGANAPSIETTYQNGIAAIDGASTVIGALSAYNAVTWP